jgi:3-oxoacyl-[acyl-carrier-protein] synthase II
MNDNVVITGAGLVSPLGLSVSETWSAVTAGQTGIRKTDNPEAPGFPSAAAAPVLGLDPADLNIHPRDARIMDKHAYMLMKSSHDAFRSAGVDRTTFRDEEIGFFAGMGMVDYTVRDILPAVRQSLNPEGNIDYDTFYSKGFREIYPLWPLSMLNNISFCQVAISLNIKGENTVFSPHADSGIQAIAEAFHSLRDKKVRVALAGGVSEKISPESHARARLHGILEPEGVSESCRPFSEERIGTVLGEGCGVLSLELRSSADKRGIPYSAMVAGFGYGFGKEDSCFCPTPQAISRSMQNAISSARIKPSDVDVVIAHADGTRRGDKNEIDALHRVFGGSLDRTVVYSSKGAFGNLLAGASAVDTILGTLIFEHGIVPPVLNSDPLDKNIRFRIANGESAQTQPKRIMVNALSYEGQCASLIIESIPQG